MSHYWWAQANTMYLNKSHRWQAYFTEKSSNMDLNSVDFFLISLELSTVQLRIIHDYWIWLHGIILFYCQWCLLLCNVGGLHFTQVSARPVRGLRYDDASAISASSDNYLSQTRIVCQIMVYISIRKPTFPRQTWQEIGKVKAIVLCLSCLAFISAAILRYEPEVHAYGYIKCTITEFDSILPMFIFIC